MGLVNITHPDTGWITRRYNHKTTKSYLGTNDERLISDSGWVSTGSQSYDLTESIGKYIGPSNWRAKIRNGQNASTPMHGTRNDLSVTPGWGYARQRRIPFVGADVERFYDTVYGGIFQVAKPASISSISLTTADNLAKTRFINAARNAQTAFQGGVYLGEARESMRMLDESGKRADDMVERYLRNVWNDAKRYSKRPRRSRDPIELLNLVRRRYLEHTFGFAPLANDVKKGAEALARMQTDKAYRPTQRVTGSATESSVIDYALASVKPGSTNLTFTGRVMERTTASVKYYGIVRSGLDTLSSVNQYLGFDPSNWLPTAWEILPYSWLADYVTNTGDIVSALSFNRSSLLWASKGTLQQKVANLYGCQMGVGFEGTTFIVEDRVFSPPQVRWNCRIVDRTANAGSLIPDFTFSLGDTGWRQRLNIAAVASQGRSVERFLRNIFL